jgi:hypothetical protein
MQRDPPAYLVPRYHQLVVEAEVLLEAVVELLEEVVVEQLEVEEEVSYPKMRQDCPHLPIHLLRMRS